MSLEEFVSSLNDEQLTALNHLLTCNDECQCIQINDCVEFAMELRGLL